MTVKDGAAGLARCLGSVSGLVDRITVGDTGSRDGSCELARSYGAEVFPVLWEQDFARARNAVLARATCDWVLVLDADEMLDAEGRDAIPALIDQAEVFGYGVWAWNYVRELDFRANGELALRNPGLIEQARAYPAYFPSYSIRLFRRDPRICFAHCVHETVADSLDAHQLQRTSAPFPIHHFGYVEEDAAARQAKGELYYGLALRKQAAAPGSYRPNIDAGMAELDHAKSPARALPYFKAACLVEPRGAAGWLYSGICLTRLRRLAEALPCLGEAVKLDPSRPLGYSALADVHFQSGNHARACEYYRMAAARGDAAPLSQAKWGAAEVQSGAPAQGLDRVRAAAEAWPTAGELWEILATTAALAGQPRLACEAAQHRLSLEGVTGFHYLLTASILEHSGDPQGALAVAAMGLGRFPLDPELASFRGLHRAASPVAVQPP